MKADWLTPGRVSRSPRTLFTALPVSAWLMPLVLVALGVLPVVLLQQHRNVEDAPAGLRLRTSFLASEAAAPPADSADWQSVTLPHARWAPPGNAAAASWYRVEFDSPTADQEPWAAYLPYLYNGGGLWLNGAPIANLLSSQPGLYVRWERPQLVALPPGVLRPRGNTLFLRLPPPFTGTAMRMPIIELAPLRQALPVYDRRLFWVRTMAQATVAAGILVPCFVLFIWWRQRSEVLYGLFGVAALLWAVRTLTFVLEVMPENEWRWWRVGYHAATGGFVVVMALFSLRYARLRSPLLDRVLIAYALVGPLWMAVRGPDVDSMVGIVWGAGLIPIGLCTVLAAAWAAVIRRERMAPLLLVALALAVCAGVHDYLMAYDSRLLARWLPGWTEQRFFLLHHAANLLLLVMGVLLTQRFIETLTAIKNLNHTLEGRVAAREAELAGNYERMAAMQQERAASDERRRIMRDLHDGLGSQLFILLSRVERGVVQTGELSQSLRACIADMRLSLDALAAHDAGLESALADFLYRWQPLLREAGIHPSWRVDMTEQAPAWISAQTTLQLLRLLQEALTNVIKHAGARNVQVTVEATGEYLMLALTDDGHGFRTDEAAASGRGLLNMHARAAALRARLSIESDAAGTHLRLDLPRPPAR